MRESTDGLMSHFQTLKPEGEPDTLDYKFYFTTDDNTVISPWHDIALRGNERGTFNFVNEIPRGTRAKLEINKEVPHNPIIQDTKDGKLRYYHSDSLVNYGALPQTWEDPRTKDIASDLAGDGDPVDAIEIGEQVATVGEIYEVVVLGALMMIDGGEADWKIVVVRATDPLASSIRDIADAPEDVQQRMAEIRSWFRDYKIPDGKPPNEFAFDGEYQGPAVAGQVIDATHGHWLNLVHGDGYEDYWLKDDAVSQSGAGSK